MIIKIIFDRRKHRYQIVIPAGMDLWKAINQTILNEYKLHYLFNKQNIYYLLDVQHIIYRKDIDLIIRNIDNE